MNEKVLFQNGAESQIACPECGPSTRLVVRTNRQNQSQFLGCPKWPECNHTRPIPESWRLKAAGAQMLPGMDDSARECVEASECYQTTHFGSDG